MRQSRSLQMSAAAALMLANTAVSAEPSFDARKGIGGLKIEETEPKNAPVTTTPDRDDGADAPAQVIPCKPNTIKFDDGQELRLMCI